MTTTKTVSVHWQNTGITEVRKEVDGFVTQLKTVQKHVDASKNGMQQTTTTIENYGKKTNVLGGQLNGLAMRFVGLQAVVGYATRAIETGVEWIKTSIEEYKNFQNAIAEVSTILLDDEMEALGAVTASIENLSVKYGKSAEDVAAGMYDILSAAFESKDAMNLLNTAVRASVAGLSTVEESVDVLTTILNAYGMSAYQASNLSDQLFETVRRGKVIFEELASSMGYIVPIAANFGVEIEEVEAALATATRQGQRADMATRGLALAFQNIVDPAEKSKKAAAEYGVDLSDIALRVGGLQSVLEDLNQAMKEHGAKVLPELITNMRSLRVVMALVSEEGLVGYEEDLNLINEASGRTEQAVTKMSNTVKMQTDILDQSMKQVERDLGKSMYGIDIYFKKSQLWWATLLSGGDADAAVRKVDDRIMAIRSSYIELFKTQAKLALNKPIDVETMKFQEYAKFDDAKIERQLSYYKELEKLGITGNEDKIKELTLTLEKAKMYEGETIASVINKNLDWESINTYMEYGGKAENLSKELSEAQEQSVYWTNEYDKKLKEITNDGSAVANTTWSIISGIETFGKVVTDIFEPILPPGLAKDIRGEEGALSKQEQAIGSYIITNKKFYDDLVESLTETQRTINETLATGEEGFNQLAGGLDALSEAAKTTEENINELQYAIDDLEYRVVDAYKTLGGQTFSGVDRWSLAVEAAGVSIDRFSRFSDIAIKYGDDFNNNYMDGTKSIKGYSEAVGDANDYLNYYNESVWEATIADSDYKGSIDNIIESLSKYNKELKQSSDALQKNNIAIQELELKGMMRRHGLTRGEENKIKKLKIENAKISLDQAKKEFGTLDEYKDLYDEYLYRAKFAYENIKDARDSDLEDLILSIKQAGDNYKKYLGYLDKQKEKLGFVRIALDAIVYAIDNGKSAEQWKEFFGQSAAATYLDTLTDIVDYLSKISGNTPSIPGSKPNEVVLPGERHVDVGNRGGETKYKITKIGIAPNGNDRYWSSSGMLMDAPKGSFKYKVGDPVSWQRGSYFIPKTQPYMLHEGERVVPAGHKSGGGDIHVHLDPIKINAVLRTKSDIDSFGVMVGRAIASGVIDGVTSMGEVG